MSGFIGPKPADVPVGTIATKGTISGNSLVVGTNNATIGTSLYVVANGSVGIGTNSPTGYSGYTTLEVRGPNGGLVQIGNTGTTAGYMFHTGVDMGIASLTSGVLNFYNSNILRMQISNTGNIGIGTSPAYRFHAMANGTSTSHRGNVVGAFSSNGSGYNATFRLSDNVTNSSDISLTGSTVELSVNGVSSLYYNASGYVGIGTTLTTVNDVTAGGRPFIVSKSDSSTTVGGSTASLVIANPNTTANNISQLGFATLYDSSASYWNQSASIGCIFGPRTNTPNYYASGTLVFLTAPGGAANGGNERMRIAANGNVGIACTAPTYRLHVDGGIFAGKDTSTEGGQIGFGRSVDNAQMYCIDTYGNDTNPQFRIFNDLTPVVFFSASNTGVNYIKFNPTQAAQGDANCLDDYEEGTWTPVLKAAGGNPTITYVNQTGYYTKVGRMVHITCAIAHTSTSGGSGNLYIDGLPFTVNGSSIDGGISIGLTYSWGTNYPIAGCISAGTTIIYLMRNFNNTNATASDLMTGTSGGQNYIRFQATYIV